jgi:murein DD-endopeptidase MepM/ murein hydrolase activator NlpD
MKQLWHIASVGLIMLAVACTQEPAEVDYRGDEFFGRTHEGALDNPNHETYPENSPRIKQDYARPVEQAQVQSVGVSDLPPPTQHSQQQTASPSSRPAQGQTNTQFIWPVADGKVILHFGPGKGGRSNDGINISVSEGEPIWAAAGGTVVYAGNDLKGYGNMVIIRHNGGWMTAYAHARSLTVKKDATVRQGDIVGYVGMTGGVQSPQLHFAIRDGRTPVDPELYLPRNKASAQ